MTQPESPTPEQRFDINAPLGQIGGWPLTPQRILLILAVLCFALAFLGGVGDVNLIALGLGLGFAAFLF
jgi:hypothetical protein